MRWFKHMSDMRHDPRIRRVIRKYGIEGYGLYCLVIESIVQQMSSSSPIPDMQEDCEDLAGEYYGDTAKINEMVSFMINQGLFKPDEMTGLIVCHKIYKYLDTSMTNSPELRKMIKGYRQKISNEVSECHDMVSECQDRTEENRTEQKEKRKYADTVLLTEEEYEKLCKRYEKVDVDKKILSLDAYQENKKHYKNHYKTLLNWLAKDCDEKKEAYCPVCHQLITEEGCGCTS